MKPYRYAEIYQGVKEGGKPRMDKPWFVFYYYRVPDSYPPKWERFREKGGLNRIKTYDDRLAMAKALVRTIDRELDKGYCPFDTKDPKTTYLNIERAVEWSIAQKQWSPESRVVQMSSVNIFLKAMGAKLKINVRDLTRQQGREIIASMVSHTETGDKSFNRYKRTLYGIFDELKEFEYIDTNPFDFRGRREDPPKKKAIPNIQQLEKIREHLLVNKPGLLDFIKVLNMTTIRGTEILRLTDKDIDTDKWLIYLDYMRVKDREARSVVIPVNLRPVIQSHLVKGCYLFGANCQPEARPKPMKYKRISALWDKYVKVDLGIQHITPYAFKYLGIQTMLSKGINPKGVQYQAGHSNQTMTDLYSGKDATLFTAELEKFEGNI